MSPAWTSGNRSASGPSWLAGIQLDGEADVGLFEAFLEQLDAAVVVRRLLVLAGRDGERDGLVRRGGFGGVLSGRAAAGAAGDDEGGCCEHRRGDSASARRSGCAHVTLLLSAHVFVLAGRDIRWPRPRHPVDDVFARGEIVVDHAVKLRPGGSADSYRLRSVRKAMSRRVEHASRAPSTSGVAAEWNVSRADAPSWHTLGPDHRHRSDAGRLRDRIRDPARSHRRDRRRLHGATAHRLHPSAAGRRAGGGRRSRCGRRAHSTARSTTAPQRCSMPRSSMRSSSPTRTPLHVDTAIECLEAGVAVLLEKPVAVDYARVASARRRRRTSERTAAGRPPSTASSGDRPRPRGDPRRRDRRDRRGQRTLVGTQGGRLLHRDALAPRAGRRGDADQRRARPRSAAPPVRRGRRGPGDARARTRAGSRSRTRCR